MVAMAAGAVAILTNLLGLIRTDDHLRLGAPVWKVLLSTRHMNVALALGAVSFVISIVVHSRWGHGPGTVAPLDFGRLLAEHEAFPAVGAMLLLASVLALFRNRRQRHGSAT
jgi:hypothetical protein